VYISAAAAASIRLVASELAVPEQAYRFRSSARSTSVRAVLAVVCGDGGGAAEGKGGADGTPRPTPHTRGHDTAVVDGRVAD
jgi:hypothetical protein